MRTTIGIVALAAMAAGSVCLAKVDVSKLPPPAAEQDVTYSKHIKPLLDASCVRCHGSDRPKAGLRLDSLEGALKGSKEGKIIVPGESAKSLIVLATSQLDPELVMPPKPRPGRGPGRPGGPGGGDPKAGTNAPAAGNPGRGPGGAQMGPPAQPLTAEQVGLLRAWIDQGAK